MSAENEVSTREAILTLVGGIGAAAVIALLLLFCGCIEIANVESFVTVPRGVCFSAENTQTKEGTK